MITDAAGILSRTPLFFVRHCLRVHTSHPGTNVYTISFFTYRCVAFYIPYPFVLHSAALPCALIPLSFYNHLNFDILNSHSLLSHLIFCQPPSPLLSLVFFLIYNHSNLFFLTTGIFGFSCRRVWAPPYLPYKSRHSDFFFCFIFFSGDFLFICRTRS